MFFRSLFWHEILYKHSAIYKFWNVLLEKKYQTQFTAYLKAKWIKSSEL